MSSEQHTLDSIADNIGSNEEQIWQKPAHFRRIKHHKSKVAWHPSCWITGRQDQGGRHEIT